MSDTRQRGLRVGRYLIYGLIDPRDSCLCYIGKTHKRREIRLAEHIEDALSGSSTPVHAWIRDVLSAGARPEVFVLDRVPPHSSWKEAEKRAISTWRAWPKDSLPYVHPAQTRKSQPTIIRRVKLYNVRVGG